MSPSTNCSIGEYYDGSSCIQCPAGSYCVDGVQNSCIPGKLCMINLGLSMNYASECILIKIMDIRNWMDNKKTATSLKLLYFDMSLTMNPLWTFLSCFFYTQVNTVKMERTIALNVQPVTHVVLQQHFLYNAILVLTQQGKHYHVLRATLGITALI